jgi:fucose permease
MQQPEPLVPEAYPRRPAAVAALLSLFVFALSSNALPAVLLRAADGLAVSMGALAQVAAVQFAGFFIAAVAGGILADHVGKKCILLTACGLMLAGSVVWSLANNLPAAFAGGALMGLGGGVIESMSSTVLSDLFPDRRKFILNLSQVIYCAGAVAGPVIMGWLLPLGISWRVCFAGIAGAGLILTFLFARAILPVPAEDERIHLAALKAIVHRRTFILPCIAIFLYVLTETGVIVYGNAYLQTVHHAPERWAILFLSFFWIGMMAGRWGCALIPERIPYTPLIAGFLVIAALTLILQQWAGGWVSSLVLLTLTGTAFCGIWPLIVGLSASLNSGYSGTVLGVTIAAGSLGCVAAPTMLNTLFARVPPAAIFPITAVPLLLAALALLLIRQER